MNDKVRMLNFGGVPLNKTDIDQAKLNIEDKQRSNLFQWNGQFSPQFIEVVLQKYAPKGGLVLDPFAGSGTVLYEACRLGMSAMGIDVNPAAFQIASLYRFANIDKEAREQHIVALEKAFAPLMGAALPLFVSGQQPVPIRDRLLSVRQAQTDELRKILLDALIIFMDFAKDGAKGFRVGLADFEKYHPVAA
jgi:16S rRNA G966 N2-methylase RsmD